MPCKAHQPSNEQNKKNIYLFDLVHQHLSFSIINYVNSCFTALVWTPGGQRAKTTWRRTLEKVGKSGVVDLRCGQSSSAEQRALARECDGPDSPTGTTRNDDDGDELGALKAVNRSIKVGCFSRKS